MTPERFFLIAQKLRPYTQYLCLHLMGEPLLHPSLREVLSIAHTLGFRVILTTNGTLLRETGQLLLESPAIHKVQISLQSFEANETGALEPYLEVCTAFAEKAAAQGILCTLRLWNLDGASTEGRNTENPLILRLLERQFPQPWIKNTRGWRLRDRIFLEWGETFSWPDANAPQGDAPRACYALQRQLGVLADGTAVPCCLDRNGDLALGNLLTQSVDELLQSPRAVALMQGFAQHRAVEPLCRSCGFAERFRV